MINTKANLLYRIVDGKMKYYAAYPIESNYITVKNNMTLDQDYIAATAFGTTAGEILLPSGDTIYLIVSGMFLPKGTKIIHTDNTGTGYETILYKAKIVELDISE